MATKKKAKVGALEVIHEVKGRSSAAAALDGQLFWASEDELHRFSLEDGKALGPSPSQGTSRLGGTTVVGDDVVVAVHSHGIPSQLSATRFSLEGKVLGETEVIGLSGIMGVAQAFGAACVVPYDRTFSEVCCLTARGLTKRALDGGGFEFDNTIVGSEELLVLGAMKWNAPTETFERQIRAYDQKALAWTRPLKLIETRSAEHGLLAVDPKTEKALLLDPATGKTTLELEGAVYSGLITPERIIVTTGDASGGSIHCLSRKDGVKVWSTSFKGKRFFGRVPLITGDRVLSFDASGALVALSLESGALVGQGKEKECTGVFGVDGLPYVGVTTVRPTEYCLRIYRVRE